MSVEVIESIPTLKAKLNGAGFLGSNDRRARALEYYFARRGIIQVELPEGPINGNAWPKLAYPPAEKLEGQIHQLNERLKGHASTKWKWQLAHLRASSNDVVAHAQKLTDPLFWKHVAKHTLDADYRKDARTIDLKSNLVSDPKYRPMVDAFVNNPEYRKQLTETVKTSIVYQNHKGLAQNASVRKKMQMDVSQSLLDKTEDQLREAQEQLFALKELWSWSRER